MAVDRKPNDLSVHDAHNLRANLKGISKAASDVFRRATDMEWKTYTDDIISFELPDDPLIKINSLIPEARQPIEIVGSSVGTTERQFQRDYYVTVERRPYLTVFVAETSWFDRGTCFCGSIAFRRWIAMDGNLLQFSFMDDGNLKKGEALGARNRAILLEWTHTSITQHDYARIARSLRLKDRSTRTEEDWIQRTMEADPESNMIGWLRVGDSSERVQQLAGKPTKVDGETWIYVKERLGSDGDGYRSTVRVSMKDGKFGRFEKGWNSFEEVKSMRGLFKDAVNQLKDQF